jgi:hypothetical protein
MDPTKFYPGCYGRADVTVAPFDAAGNKGVTFFLNGVQFARHGERLATNNPGDRVKAGFAAAGALPISEADPYQQVGFGANTAPAGFAPPGTVPGFAAAPNGAIPPNAAPVGGAWQPATRPPGL